jgi:hypothetical protein
VGFEVLMLVLLRISVLCDVILFTGLLFREVLKDCSAFEMSGKTE